MAKVRRTNIRAFCARLARVLAEDGAEFVRPIIRQHSRTLADALTIVYKKTGDASLFIPHYWAVYVHDGRGAPFGAKRAKFLVWFRNPKDDPRISNGYPVRVNQIRRLKKSEFRIWAARNAAARKAGLPEPMLVRSLVKNPTAATNFFDNEGGMADWLNHAQEKGTAFARALILDQIGKDLFISETLRVRL